MIRVRKVFSLLLLSFAAFALAPRTAAASPIQLTLEGSSDSTLGANVLLSYASGLLGLTGQLTLAITNTSDFWDPRLTSFAFNVPLAVMGVTSFSSSIGGWDYVFDRDDINTPGQFGLFDVGGITGPNFNGGSPNSGIARNQTATFQFGFVGVGLNFLNESSFINLLSYDSPGGANEAEQSFIARFQRTGANGGGSDVAIPTTNVPEPSSLLLMGTGLAALVARRRKTATAA